MQIKLKVEVQVTIRYILVGEEKLYFTTGGSIDDMKVQERETSDELHCRERDQPLSMLLSISLPCSAAVDDPLMGA